MKKYSLTKKLISFLLAALAIVGMTCSGAFALAGSEGGADLYIGSGDVVHYEDVSEAFEKAIASKYETKLVLKQDWTADENGSFGKGDYFPGGGIGIVDRHEGFTLDLNGYKIDRGLKSAKSQGYVFFVYNSDGITITDSSRARTGLITGGFSKGNGGAFRIEGSYLTVSNLTVKGNITSSRGGAFWVDEINFENLTQLSRLTLDGCTVTENKAQTGGAIYVESSNLLRIFDTSITGNSAEADGGVHTEVRGFFRTKLTLGGKVVIADNLTEKDGKGLMLDESFFTKVYVEYDSARPLSEDSRIVVLSKTDDKTLRITDDSSESNIGCFEYETDKYEIVEKGSGDEKYLDIKKA